MLDAYVYDGIRTPFGRRGGALAPVRPDDLLAHVLRTVAERTGLDPARLDDVVVGCADQAGEDSRCVARHASLLAGCPETVPGTVVQRNCGSGLGAIIAGAHALTAGEAELVMSGGVESMTRAPFVVAKGEQAFDPRFSVYDSAVGARFPNPRIAEQYGDDTMPQTADNLAVEYGIERAAADAFALRSQQRWARASGDDFFDGELVPVTIPGSRRRPETLVTEDEPPQPDTAADRLAQLPALNAGGVTTAGNAAGINDGAVAMLLGTRAAADGLQREPLARLVASAVAGVAPRVMGIGPVAAGAQGAGRAPGSGSPTWT
ncbi:MAG: acetyl-CoA C-acyltransferase [Halofilum sp. (in: g-proteobacteria)]|nr:acetyl-CoA C-acyltransferase [Halofilum sp. (in: g-proteobacteria)]